MQTVAYLEVDESSELISSLPSIITDYSDGQLDGTYILPPVRYPDGKYYLKLGHGDNFERLVHTYQVTDRYQRHN